MVGTTPFSCPAAPHALHQLNRARIRREVQARRLRAQCRYVGQWRDWHDQRLGLRDRRLEFRASGAELGAVVAGGVAGRLDTAPLMASDPPPRWLRFGLGIGCSF